MLAAAGAAVPASSLNSRAFTNLGYADIHSSTSGQHRMSERWMTEQKQPTRVPSKMTTYCKTFGTHFVDGSQHCWTLVKRSASPRKVR